MRAGDYASVDNGAISMNSRQRITAALLHQEPDRTPVFEYVLLSPVADTLLGRPYCDYAGDYAKWQTLVSEIGWECALRRYATDRVALASRLGHDMLYVVFAPLPPQPVAGVLEKDAPVELEHDDPVERVLRRAVQIESSSGRLLDDQLLVYHLFREEMSRHNLDLPILAPAYVHGVWTDVDLMQTMILEPKVAHRYFAQMTRIALTQIEQYLAIGLEQIGVGGDFSGTRPLISPHAYRTFIMPEVRAVSSRIHASDAWAVNASDGNLWPVIDEFLLGCEVDGYLEIDLHAGMDLRRLKQTHGNRITFYGNMDCGNTLSFATPEEIRRATIDCLEAGAGNGGHIFCASNAITESVPVANYLAMVNAYREVFDLGAVDVP
jgi:uroporphyrinogen decarboxylase